MKKLLLCAILVSVNCYAYDAYDFQRDRTLRQMEQNQEAMIRNQQIQNSIAQSNAMSRDWEYGHIR